MMDKNNTSIAATKSVMINKHDAKEVTFKKDILKTHSNDKDIN